MLHLGSRSLKGPSQRLKISIFFFLHFRLLNLFFGGFNRRLVNTQLNRTAHIFPAGFSASLCSSLECMCDREWMKKDHLYYYRWYLLGCSDCSVFTLADTTAEIILIHGCMFQQRKLDAERRERALFHLHSFEFLLGFAGPEWVPFLLSSWKPTVVCSRRSTWVKGATQTWWRCLVLEWRDLDWRPASPHTSPWTVLELEMVKHRQTDQFVPNLPALPPHFLLLSTVLGGRDFF